MAESVTTPPGQAYGPPMIKHGDTTIIHNCAGWDSCPNHAPVASGFTTTPEYRIAYFAEAARMHPAARRSRFRRRVWRDDQSLDDREYLGRHALAEITATREERSGIHAASAAARRLSTVTDAQLDQALADLRDGVTP
jgi:hypothetical protein